MLTVVADFCEDPVGECHASTEDESRSRSTDADHVDDVGDGCYCHDSDRDATDLGADLDGLIEGASSSSPRRHGCSRWYPRLRALMAGALHRNGGVGVLVNAAGTSYPHPEFFTGMLADGQRDSGRRLPEPNSAFCSTADRTLRCNAAALMHVCRLTLPGMLHRGRGLVVNVGSASAAVPASPLMAAYSASKVGTCTAQSPNHFQVAKMFRVVQK